MTVAPEVAVDDQAHRRARGVDLRLHLLHRPDVLHDVEVLRGGHLRHELAALEGAALVEDDGLQVLHVVVDGVAEDERLEQRHHDDHPKGHAVALELQELFPGEGEKACHAATSSLIVMRLRASETNTSSSEGSAGSGEPKADKQRVRVARIAVRGDGAHRQSEQIGVFDGRFVRETGSAASNGSPSGRTSRMRPREVAFQLAGRAGGDRGAVEDERQAVALLGLVHVVRRDEHGHAAVGRQLVDQVPEQAPAARVDAAGGLVEEEQLGLVDQRRRKRSPLPQPGRQPLGELVEDVREPEPLDKTSMRSRDLLAVETVDASRRSGGSPRP